MKVVICGGHFSPAYALIEELKRRPDIEIVFFGRKFTTEGSGNFSAEYKIMSRENIKSHWIVTGRIQRRFSIYTLQALAKIPIGFLQSFFYLLLERPNIIVSFGGSLSFPAVFCGWILGISSVTHEQAVVPGLATRLNSLFAKKIFISWPQSKTYFKGKKLELIGNLERKIIFKKTANDTKINRFLSNKKKTVFITGGNQGSHILNRFTFEWIKKVKDYQIIHQVGTANFKGDLKEAQKIKRDNYLALDFVKPEDVGAVFNSAYVVISRAGANTCWEIATLKKPSILIPLPISAGSEQEKNAEVLEKTGFVEVVNQKDLNALNIERTTLKISANYQKYTDRAEYFAQDLPKNAVQRMTEYLVECTS